jgi:flagellar secretion chaperone FliS
MTRDFSVQHNVAKYRDQQVLTASPAKLVFLLYERAIGSLREAAAAIEAGDVEGRWRANRRAIEILSHMWSTLDHEKGGEIAEKLDSLFPFMVSRLTQIDINNDIGAAQEVISLLQPLHDSWRTLALGAPGRASDGTAGAAGERPAPIDRTRISA